MNRNQELLDELHAAERRQKRLAVACLVLAAFGAGYWVRKLTTPAIVISIGGSVHVPQPHAGVTSL